MTVGNVLGIIDINLAAVEQVIPDGPIAIHCPLIANLQFAVPHQVVVEKYWTNKIQRADLKFSPLNNVVGKSYPVVRR